LSGTNRCRSCLRFGICPLRRRLLQHARKPSGIAWSASHTLERTRRNLTKPSFSSFPHYPVGLSLTDSSYVSQIENDHMVLLSRVWDFIEANFQDDSQVSPQLRALCLGYAEGVNYFAHTNPKKLITEKLFPVTPDDIIASVLHKGMHFSGFHRQLKHLLNQSEEFDRIATPFKGTSFAVSSDMTEDASTFLLINPHAPWGGPSSVYEVSLLLSSILFINNTSPCNRSTHAAKKVGI